QQAANRRSLDCSIYFSRRPFRAAIEMLSLQVAYSSTTCETATTLTALTTSSENSDRRSYRQDSSTAEIGTADLQFDFSVAHVGRHPPERTTQTVRCLGQTL